MTYRDRTLDNPINWSFRAGRMFGIDIRIHFTFILGAFVLIAMSLPGPDEPHVSLGRILIYSLGAYAMLFFVVLVHEFGHCFGARRTGGEANEILLWPLGGLASVQPPHEPAAHMITTLAGPAVNVVFCAISSAILVLWTGKLGAVPWNPLHPVTPVSPDVFPTTGQMWVMRFFGISYVLLLINMLPIFPFDGGRVLQAWLWPRRGYRDSMTVATATGMWGAIAIGVFGLFAGEWLLLMIAVFGYITCWQTRRAIREGAMIEGGFGSQFGESYEYDLFESEPRRKPGLLARRRAEKVRRRAEKEREEREERARAIEEALKQISVGGVESLTPKQKKLLEEETRRRRESEMESNDAV